MVTLWSAPCIPKPSRHQTTTCCHKPLGPGRFTLNGQLTRLSSTHANPAASPKQNMALPCLQRGGDPAGPLLDVLHQHKIGHEPAERRIQVVDCSSNAL